jgi:hypothetical protein
MKTILLVILSVILLTSCKKENMLPLNGTYTCLGVLGEDGNYYGGNGVKYVFNNTDVCEMVYNQQVNSFTYGDTTLEVRGKMIWKVENGYIYFKTKRSESWKYSPPQKIDIIGSDMFTLQSNLNSNAGGPSVFVKQ